MSEVVVTLSLDTDLVDRLGVWAYHDDTARYMTMTASSQDMEEYYIWVRMEGADAFCRVSLGVLHRPSEGSFTFPEAPDNLIDPTPGHVVRIVSIEESGCNGTLGELTSARHLSEVIRKQAGWCDSLPEGGAVPTFAVLRSRAYMDALREMTEPDCSARQWLRSMEDVDSTEEIPWSFVNLLAEDQLSLIGRLARSFGPASTQPKELTDDFWLVMETLPQSTNVDSCAYSAARKSAGSNSIPTAKVWDVVVMRNAQDQEEFVLLSVI